MIALIRCLLSYKYRSHVDALEHMAVVRASGGPHSVTENCRICGGWHVKGRA